MTKKEKEKKIKKVKKTEVKKEPKAGFFKLLKTELSKVKWPAGKEVVKYSVATIVFIIIFALFFEGINLVGSLLRELFS